jgi:hypothetical protein
MGFSHEAYAGGCDVGIRSFEVFSGFGPGQVQAIAMPS